MIPAAFEYRAPESLKEAAALLARHREDAKLLAGGHSLIPVMKLRLAEPKMVIDLSRIPGLSYIEDSGDTIRIGAMTTHYTIESSDLLQQKLTALQEAASCIGDVQVRNKGTIGGSLAHADPAADYPAPILAFGAELVAQGPRADRVMPAARFFVGLLTTALRPLDILREIRIPAPPAGSGSAYTKLYQKASGFAIVGVAAVVTVKNGVIDAASVAVTGVAPKAFKARWVEKGLVGREPDPKVLQRAARRVMRGVEEVNDDLHASADYRRAMAVVYTQRALEKAVERATA
jgi:carbon-monoxide dehydrogenase medium subunit